MENTEMFAADCARSVDAFVGISAGTCSVHQVVIPAMLRRQHDTLLRHASMSADSGRLD
jgi:hypothetical protein